MEIGFTLCFWIKTKFDGFFTEYKVISSEDEEEATGFYFHKHTLEILLNRKQRYYTPSVSGLSREFLFLRDNYDPVSLHILKDALSVWTNLGKHLQFVWLCVFRIKTGTRRIMRLDELSLVMRLQRRTTKDSSSGRIVRLCVPRRTTDE